ncbi:hypothetical protein NE237_021536 [Protea cynaroides]|uniref:Uncharacterized protein n=1 Tax=Protea cynaroides TaxID=273540 RepID=A0A9Q0H801_9MAGN|nr:hypothetical protein NE237_021536 [Protea cynaroides]
MVPAVGTVEVSFPSPKVQESFVASGKNPEKRSSSQGRTLGSAKSPYWPKWHVNQAKSTLASSEVMLQVVEGMCLPVDVKSFDKMALSPSNASPLFFQLMNASWRLSKHRQQMSKNLEKLEASDRALKEAYRVLREFSEKNKSLKEKLDSTKAELDAAR